MWTVWLLTLFGLPHQGFHDKVLEDCDTVLSLNASNCKALYRKSKALSDLGRYKEAYDAVAKCSLAVPQVWSLCFRSFVYIITILLILFFFLIFFLNLFIYGCVGSLFLCEGFLQLRQAGATPTSRCAGPSPSWPLLLWSTGSRRAGSAIVAHGPSRSAARGILPDQGLNPCPLHWQADSQPLRHQGSPFYWFCVEKWP